MPECKSLGALIDEIRALLRDHGVENFYNEARWIIAEILNLSVSQLVSQTDGRRDKQVQAYNLKTLSIGAPQGDLLKDTS